MAWAVEPLKNENMANWQIEPARVAEQTVLDDDTGQIYRAPVTFDEQDIRFAIATQVNKEPKRDFIGKVKYAAGEAWNWAEKFADRVEGGFQSAERGAVGLAGQALDTFLHASLSVSARVEQIEKYKNGDFSDWDASLNGRVTDEDIAKEADPALQAAMQFRKDRQDALMAKAEERLEQRQRIRRKLDASIRKWQEVLRPEAEMNNYDRFMEAMGSGTASLALSVATLAATKNPQVAAGIMAGTFGRMRYTDVFDKSVEKGLDYATADDYATIAGTIEGGIELALEPFLYGVANLRPVRKITDEMIGGAVARLNATAAGKSAARKIVSKHRQSVGKQSLKAAAIEGSEEALQEAGGAYFENYTGLENTPQEEIMARTLLSFAVGGLTGAGAAVMGTSAYNREAAATNERIKQSLAQAYPELTTEEKQKTADALQEIFYQDGEGRMLNELELLADKENDPDTLESGKHEISEDMRSILKKRYQMSDEEIDRTAEIAVASIDLRNQFNEAQTAFYDELVKIGTNPNVAEPFSRLMAARASAVAMNEKKTVKDVLERWNLKFERKTRPIDYNALLDDEILFQSEAYDTQGKADINTPEFKAWFGGSKVVDESGQPRVVYHGTPNLFSAFDKAYLPAPSANDPGFYGQGFYFADSYPASWRYTRGKGVILPLYLSIKNPLVLDDVYNKTMRDIPIERIKELGIYKKGLETGKYAGFFFDEYVTENRLSKRLSDHAKAEGYDGIKAGKEFVVFEPNQIKSVFNRGTWDAGSDNIYYQEQISKNIENMPSIEDFRNPNKDYELPRLNPSDLFKLGKEDKPVVLKKNIIEKNKNNHPEVDISEYGKILTDTLVDTSEIIQVQPQKKPNYYTFINNNQNDVSVVELSENKDNYEVVNFFKVNKKRIDEYRKKAVKDGGDIIITERKPQGAARLSALLNNSDNNIASKEENVNSSLRQGAPENARGAYDAAKRLIMLFEGADPSTLVHEAAHFFLDDMRRFADNATTAEELQAIYRYVGSTDGVLTTEQNEYFARSFEAYLMEGKAPNSLLGRVFEKFRKWLRAIYSQIKNLNVKLDDNIRKTFDEMLGGRRLDFALQMSRERLAEDIKAGNIGQTVINKALRLLEEGKMSKADMEEMIGRLEDGRLKRSDVKKYLEPFAQSTNRHHEAVYEQDYQRYRCRLEKGNVTPAAVRKKIDRLLEWTKPRTQNGKVVGRFPDIKVNRFFDAVRENINLKRDEALAKIDANLQRLDEITQKGMSGEDGNFRNVSDIIWENKVLAIPAGRASVGLMADVYNDIAEIYNTGRLSERVTGMVKRAWRERLIGEAVAVLDQGQGTNWRRESSDLAKRMRRFGLSMFSWNGILDVLSMFDKGSKSGESALSRNLTVFQEEKKMRYGVYEDGETVSRLMAGALGSAENGGISVNRYINKVLPEKFTIEWGSNAKRFSKDQLLDIYMKAKDPETREIMVNDDVLQFNEEFFSRVDEHLSEQDKAVAGALFQFYEETYDKLNRFYEEHYGISLGHREFYSPRSMDKGGIDVVSGDLRSYAGLSAIKKRTAKGGQIKIKGAFNVLQNYINNSNHFIAFADKLQDINAVLGDAEVKNRIRNVFGEKMNEKIAYEISRFASNDKVYVQGINGIMSKLRANYAVSVLGLKPSLAIKQLTGFPAYWENVPTKDFLEGLADFARHPKQAIETLGNSQYMKTRGTNIIKDFEEVSKSEMLKNLGTKIGLREFLMLNIQLGDRGSIYMGGWALYKYMLKKTGDPAQAMAEFERITNETQQSSYMSEQSAWQSNPFGNWFTMFQSSQNQYLRKELTVLRGLATGRMDWDKAVKTLFIYHFLLPMFFQFVSDGFRWDKDAQLRAAALGSLNGAFVLGKVMERMVDWAITGTLNYKLGIKELFPPVSVLENGAKFLSDSVKYAVDDISLEDYMEALRGAVRTAGEATGLPLKYPMDVATASGDYLDEEEYGKAVLLWLGWSPYALRDLEE